MPISTQELPMKLHDFRIMSSRIRSFGIWLRRHTRGKPLRVICGGILIAAGLTALFADALATHNPLAQDIPNRLRPPGTDFFFGTDAFGRDLFSRVVHGTRTSLYIAGLSVLLGVSFGTLIGILSAYYGRKVDLLIQRLTDTMMGFPLLVLAIMIAAALEPSIHTVVAAITIAIIPQASRLARSIALAIKTEPYVLAAKMSGAGSFRITIKHIVPHASPVILAHGTTLFGVALVAEATLSYLGLSVPPPEPSWGRMIQEGAEQFLEVAPWLALFPGIAITLIVISAAFLGDTMHHIFDPKLKEARQQNGNKLEP